MPWGLERFQHSGQTHFVTFSCYHRLPFLNPDPIKRSFELALERVRHTFQLRVYAYVIMPEHVHLLLSEPQRSLLADAIKSLKQGVSRRAIEAVEFADTESSDGAPFKPSFGLSGAFPTQTSPHHFWQKRYYDFNVRNYDQFLGENQLHPPESSATRLRQTCEIGCGRIGRKKTGRGVASVNMQWATKAECKSNTNGRHEGASERQEHSVQPSSYPTQAKRGLEWGTHGVVVLVKRLGHQAIATVESADIETMEGITGPDGPESPDGDDGPDGAPFKPSFGLSGAFPTQIPPHHFWQKRYYDFNIRNYDQFLEKINYTHQNPVRRGLCERAEDWPWSSFLQYATGGEGRVQIECERAARRRERMAGTLCSGIKPKEGLNGAPAIDEGVRSCGPTEKRFQPRRGERY